MRRAQNQNKRTDSPNILQKSIERTNLITPVQISWKAISKRFSKPIIDSKTDASNRHEFDIYPPKLDRTISHRHLQKSFKEKENEQVPKIAKYSLFSQNKSFVNKSRPVSPTKTNAKSILKESLILQLKKSFDKYESTLNSRNELAFINEFCLNHSDKLSEFYLENESNEHQKFGVCASCAVKFASCQIEVKEISSADACADDFKSQTVSKIFQKIDKLEKMQREKEELLKSNKSSLSRNYEVQKKKLDKLFEVIFTVLEKKRSILEESLKENFQNEKARLQNNFFKIFQTKQSLTQMRASLTEFSENVVLNQNEALLAESFSNFDEILRENEFVYDSIEFINFKILESFSVKKIIDSFELVLENEVCITENAEKVSRDEFDEENKEFDNFCRNNYNLKENESSSFEIIETTNENDFEEKRELEEIQIVDEGETTERSNKRE